MSEEKKFPILPPNPRLIEVARELCLAFKRCRGIKLKDSFGYWEHVPPEYVQWLEQILEEYAGSEAIRSASTAIDHDTAGR